MDKVIVTWEDEKVYEADSILEAEAFIAAIEEFEREAVHNGDFGIDASEEADAEYQRGRRS